MALRKSRLQIPENPVESVLLTPPCSLFSIQCAHYKNCYHFDSYDIIGNYNLGSLSKLKILSSSIFPKPARLSLGGESMDKRHRFPIIPCSHWAVLGKSAKAFRKVSYTKALW